MQRPSLLTIVAGTVVLATTLAATVVAIQPDLLRVVTPPAPVLSGQGGDTATASRAYEDAVARVVESNHRLERGQALLARAEERGTSAGLAAQRRRVSALERRYARAIAVMAGAAR
jgi:hypothetical protein